MQDGFVKTWPKLLLQLEGAALFLSTLWFYPTFKQSWWTFAALLFVPDLGMTGYLVGNPTGAALYNLFHTETPALLLLGVGLARDRPAVAGLAVTWLAHIGMDRMLGAGLKYGTGFGHTHLGAWKGNGNGRKER